MVQIMYYRINTISFDASRKDEFMAYADSMRSEMKNITGVQSICIIETSEGQATGVAIYDSKASAEDALPPDTENHGRNERILHSSTRSKTRPCNVVNVI